MNQYLQTEQKTTVMKKYLLISAAALLITGSAMAQDNKHDDNNDNKTNNIENSDRKTKNSNNNENKLGEYDQIIIRKKNPSVDGKVTIEIKDDQVFVNGEPIDDFENPDISVRLHDVKKFNLGPSSQFRFDDRGNWGPGVQALPGKETAFLGVMTEGSSDGARIKNVSENSAADKAGLKEGDVITKVGDKKVYDHEQLSEIIRDKKPNDKVIITYKRDGREKEATVTLGSRNVAKTFNFRGMRPDAPMPPMAFDFDGGGFHRLFDMNDDPRLGIRVQDTEDGKGVKVLNVEEGSSAYKSGIKEDDIITSFDGEKVNSAEALADAFKDAKDKSSVKVQLNRNGKPQTIEIKVPKKLKTANL